MSIIDELSDWSSCTVKNCVDIRNVFFSPVIKRLGLVDLFGYPKEPWGPTPRQTQIIVKHAKRPTVSFPIFNDARVYRLASRSG